MEITTLETQNEEKRADLVFEGGGVKGIALIGALSILEERGFQPQNLAGSSAGAIVATLRAAGYSPAELREVIGNQDFRQFMDTSWEDRIPFVGQPLSVLMEKGIYEGDYFIRRMDDLLSAKGVHTFSDLPGFREPADPRYRYKVQVIASDLTGHSLLVLPKDAAKLGVDDPDDLSVALAVRMSMSIPIFFEPVHFRSPKTGQEHLIVDGGMLSNFPVWLFDSKGVPEWPTFGLKMVEGEPETISLAERLPVSSTDGIMDYLKSLVATLTEAHDRMYLEQAEFVRTITIPTGGVRSTDFDLSKTQVEALYDAGRQAASKFLDGWYAAGGFPAYIAAFREHETPGRRDRALNLMREARAAVGVS